MKRSGLNLFILLISSVFILQSCEKSEDNTDLKSNTLSYNGVDYEVTNGKLWYYGLWTEDESVNSFEVLILSEDSKNFLRLHLLSSSNTGLSTGTYNFSDQDAAFTLTGGLFIVNYNSTNDTSDARLELNGGNVIVEKDGTKYTFTLDLNTTSGKVTGHYNGTLAFSDHSSE